LLFPTGPSTRFEPGEGKNNQLGAGSNGKCYLEDLGATPNIFSIHPWERSWPEAGCYSVLITAEMHAAERFSPQNGQPAFRCPQMRLGLQPRISQLLISQFMLQQHIFKHYPPSRSMWIE